MSSGDCSVTLPEQEHHWVVIPIDQVPLAVHVPINSEETVPEWAFAGVPRLRHVSVESGIRLYWCRGVARLPATPHCQTAGHSGRHCRQCLSGLQAPKQCLGSGLNVFHGETNFGQYLFQGCINLAEVTVSEIPSPDLN